MKKIVKILLAIVFLAALAWVVYYLYTQTKKDPTVYDIEEVKTMDIINKSVATGSVVPRKEIEIKPQESGILTKIYIEEGDRVKKGDLIAKIQIIPEMVQVNDAQNSLRKAKINFDNAQVDFNRNKDLYENRVISEQDFQSYQVQLKTSASNLEAAQNHLQLIKEGVTKQMGNQTNTLIRSTIEGMVLDVPLKEGNSVIKSNTFNDGTTVAIIADMNNMVFEGKVDETEVGKIVTGMDLLLSIGAIEEEDFAAKLEFIAPKGVEENGAVQFEIKAAVDLKDGQFIRSGYSATADIVLERHDDALAINEKVLIFRNDSTFVDFETSEQTFEERYIKTGISDGIMIEVLDGLSEKDKVKVPQD